MLWCRLWARNPGNINTNKIKGIVQFRSLRCAGSEYICVSSVLYSLVTTFLTTTPTRATRKYEFKNILLSVCVYILVMEMCERLCFYGKEQKRFKTVSKFMAVLMRLYYVRSDREHQSVVSSLSTAPKGDSSELWSRPNGQC